MQLTGEPKAFIRPEARDFINLYASLGERAEIFLPRHIMDNLRNFVELCYDEPSDPTKQQSEINKHLLEFKESIPGYTDVSLMIYPTEDSKAFQYSGAMQRFRKRLNAFIDTELLDEKNRQFAKNILSTHDFSIGTPPVNADHIKFMARILLGESVSNLRKFREILGITGEIAEGHWHYFMDVLEQMVIQTSHYTTKAETTDFLHRTEWTVNFKGLNGFMRTVVSGDSETAIKLIKGEVFNGNAVKVFDDFNPEDLYQQMTDDNISIFVVKVKHMRKNLFAAPKWFSVLTRLVIVDDSPESRSSNTSLVFAFHNGIINALDKVHTKKLGSAANTQLNIRLILENVNAQYLGEFKVRIDKQISIYNTELDELHKEQLGENADLDKKLTLYKFDGFTKQILKDRYSLEKLRDFITFLQNLREPEHRKAQNQELIDEFESRIASYFYSNISELQVATILEGGGRNQIKTYGDYLLQRPLKGVDEKVVKNCGIILEIIPNNFQRTAHNHFHKNFGINLFLEKYQQFLTKIDNSADNKGRFRNFLIDLGIYESYISKPKEEQDIIKEFISGLGNLDKTTIADDVQMIIRDLLFYNDFKPKPYIFYNLDLAWEYKDLFPTDSFDINPFDFTVVNKEDGRIDFGRLVNKLNRIKSTMQLFDPSGNLWDRFCENSTIVINDPANPTGYSDFNNEELLDFLRFLAKTKITLFLDEAYAESVITENKEEPKWRSISRYILNNIATYSKISIVSSLSTTKNLGATGNRLGCLAATPAKKSVIDYAKKLNYAAKGNNNSILMLNTVLETATAAKKIKDSMEANLPKNASRYKIKESILDFIKKETARIQKLNQESQKNKQLKRTVGFEGSPLFLLLIEQLADLDKLDVLGLPDDFKYNNEPFFSYFNKQLIKELDKFRVNKSFRNESARRLKIAKEIAGKLIENTETSKIKVIDSDGSYLFNLLLTEFSSFVDLELFCKKLAAERGVSALPYAMGVIRFSLGGYVTGTPESYSIFSKEIENGLNIFLKYWNIFHVERANPANKEIQTEDLLKRIFKVKSEMAFFENIMEDYELTKGLSKKGNASLKINDISSLYHASPEVSGISISAIEGSKNAVIEFQGNIGDCRDVQEFIKSRAFTKVYENLLAQVYKNIPQLKNYDFNTVASKYSKATLLKYITNKKTFFPNYYVLDDQEEINIMREILIEMENLLFSDSKMKILTLPSSGNIAADRSRLEGVNRILKKFIEEILLHFNLPFGKPVVEPNRKEIFAVAREKFEELIGIKVEEFNLKNYVFDYVNNMRNDARFKEISISDRSVGYVIDVLQKKILEAEIPTIDKLLYMYMFRTENHLAELVIKKLKFFDSRIQNSDDDDVRVITESIVEQIIPIEFNDIVDYILRNVNIKISAENLHRVTRKVVLFFIEIINKTKDTNFYEKYTHNLIKMVETEFRQQNSSFNEMIQHGITIHRNFEIENKELTEYEGGKLSWVYDLMTKCGVIGSEQSVQVHTRIATDAKKREYPFHKVDRVVSKKAIYDESLETPNPQLDYLKKLDVKPSSDFFAKRLARFVQTMDTEDYRCKIVKKGLFKELVVFHKAYMKYLTDNYRLFLYDDISLEDAKNFVPDTIAVFGAPEKLISFPQVGYFDIPGPRGNIKTIVTPLKQEADYFGNVKKPRLTLMNEKVKELGGIPKHGSIFLVEQEDGSLTTITIDGDSGVGKSEMIAAFILKWMRKTLPGVRSIKMIAADMFHVFQDTEGNLYAIGTEVGDFSRVTDFDPDFIRYYRYLFESSADSNVENPNSRSTISGFCDISMPYKIDIILSGANFAREDAGILKYENPENFVLYRDSHGERKEKLTSEDGPNFQRSLSRYRQDKNINELLDKHGNYIDDVLDWQLDTDGKFYLCSSFRIIDKIDIEELVRQIFIGKKFKKDGMKWEVMAIEFDIIKNRFRAISENEEKNEIISVIDRNFFGQFFEALASTPAGQPFVAESLQYETRKWLIQALKGGPNGTGKAKNIQLGVLSTDLGKKGKEITGPQKAAEGMRRLIQEVYIQNPELHRWKNEVKKIINEKYFHIFNGNIESAEIWRYNFYLFQMDQMRKAEFVRFDRPQERIDFSNVKGFRPKKKSEPFNPLLVTPNLNMELTSFGETYDELMSLPNYPDFAEEFLAEVGKLFQAEGYTEETKANNMIIQLLLMGGYIHTDDLSRGSITEKVNRETIAAAKYAVISHLKGNKKAEIVIAPVSEPEEKEEGKEGKKKKK